MVQLSPWVGIWDQATNFIKYHDIGINLHERLYKFLIDFAKLQKDAYVAQKRLCEKYLSDAQKCFGVSNSYVSFFNELVQIVQHIVDAENLISCSFEIHAGSEGKSIIEDERRQFKRWKSERSKLSTELKSQTRIIDDEIKRYRDKYRDMIKAKEDYERINADQSHSQFDVEKALNYARLKEIDFERARKDYSAALNQFNLYRQDYYFRCLPSWAQVGKSLEVERYTRTQSLINILYERLRVAIDRMNSVCDEFKSVCTHLNSDQDSEEIIKYLHSNNPPPGDIAFVDLYSSSVNNSTIQSTVKQSTYPKQQRTNSSEPIYSSGSVVLPSNFHCSVWAADNAALESSKQCGSDNNNSNNNYVPPSSTPVGESIYVESGSIYCASYASTTSTNGSHNGGVGSNCSRRPSVSDNYTALNLRNSSISINGAGFLRRIFSRRSRSVVNLKSVADLCEPARIKHQKTNDQITCLFDSKRRATHNSRITGSISRSRDNSVADPSDFSDSNSELENNGHGNKTTINNNNYRRQLRIHSTTDSDNVAYASTSVLNGLPQSMASSCQSPDAPKGAAVAAVLPVTTITTITTTHTHSPSLYSRSDSQTRSLSSGHERSSIPLYYLSTSGKSKPLENGGSSKQLLKQDKLFTAPLAESETGSIVTPIESFTQSTLTSSLSQLPESLNVQMPTLKQNLLTNRSTIINNDDNSRCSTINGDSYHNNLDSNHSNDTLIYSQMNSSYNHFELKNSDQVLYNHNKNLLKKHEQQGLWYSQLQKCQQQDQSLRHHLKHEQRITEATVDNIDSTCSISPSCYHKQDNNNNNNNNNNRQSKESQIVAIGDCSALYPFTGDGFESCYLAFETDEQFYILATDPTEDTTDWLHVCRKQRTQEIGYVPTAYVQKNFYFQPVLLPKSEYVQLQDSDSSSTRTATSTKPTLKKSVNTAQTSARSPVNSVHSNKSNYSGTLMMNRNFRGTSPYVRLSGVSRDTDL
uniref:Formin binding protein and related proteins n=1 Tax=Schistosoma mansoni TaxID=6183 RepID=A0A3Q0KPH3_SCHMA